MYNLNVMDDIDMSQGEGGGRPTLFTSKVQKKLLQALGRYAPLRTACEYAAIHWQTFYNWQAYAEECKIRGEENEHTKFFDALSEIKAERVIGLTERIASGSKGWQGASWYLERVHSKVFGTNGEMMTVLEEKLKAIEEKLNNKG